MPELLLLATLWGASFLFMRLSAPAFGPLAMAAVRVAGATALSLPLLAWRGELAQLRTHWRALAVVGITHSALPFALFGYASLHLSGGLSAVFNAATPLFGALLAWLWLHERLAGWRLVGLIVGFVGVAGLAGVKTGSLGLGAPLLSIAACLGAAALYGFAANFARRKLAGVPSLAVATGSQASAALALAIPAALTWPAQPPDTRAWLALAALALFCTGWAYILYFRLIARAGAPYATTVTYLVPATAVAWGALFLDEAVTPTMIGGCAVILLGTALATGLLPRPRRT